MKRLEGSFLGARPSWSISSNPGVWSNENVYGRRVSGVWPAPVGTYDEFYEYVTLLLHMDGANSSTTFTDSSLRNLGVTAVNSSITTSQAKFGGASGNFVRSSGGRLNVGTTNNEFVFGAGDFTLEAWVYLNSMPTSGYPGSFWILGWGGQNSNPGFDFYLTSTNIIVNIGDFASPTASGLHGMTTGQWYHIAASRNGSTVKVFVNGQEKATGTTTADAYTPTYGNAISISAAEPTGGSTGGNFDGYIDDLRITKGYCRYASSFNPPSGVFENEGAPLADPFYNYVSLLLPMNGSNNSTTFTDKSPSPRTVTPSGDAKLSTADKRYGVSSAYFDGTGDYLTIADANSGFSFGTGDFTYEWWFKSNATNNYAAMVTRPYSGAGGILISLNGATGDGAPEVYWREWTNGLFFKSSITGLNDNKWHHFAFVRSGTTVYMFIDGVQAASKTSVSTSVGSSSVIVGQDIEYAGRTYTGYIDDLRITKGVARYVANFIPPLPHADYGTLVDPYLGSTNLLMPMEGPNNSTGFFDRADRLPVTTYGNAKISNAQYKWGLTSAYFDGTGDYIDTNVAAAPTGSESFTVEAWIYPTAVTGQDRVILETRGGSGFVFFINTSGYLQVFDSVVGSASTASTTLLVVNTWQHIALSKTGSTGTYYVNGSAAGTYTLASHATATSCRIGARNDAAAAFVGYIDDLRITRGFARYTTNFTPPTAAFNSDSINDPYRASVSLHLKMDGANNSTTFTDSSLTPKAVSANGDAKISTTQSKFGGSSAYLDGNGDHLSIPNSSDFEFGSGDFTIEFWAYVTALKGYQAFIAKSYAAADQNGWGLICESSSVITFYAGNGSWTLGLSAGVTPTINTWQHYALTRSGTTWRLFIDGQVKASTTNSLTPTAGTLPLYIGRYPYFPGFNSAQDLSGYIDDLRITKGVARYTANFLPPTIAHPAF